MSLIIDQKYVSLISGKLPLFKKKTDKLYNFRCIFCGDSKKNKLKSRGYVLEHKGSMLYKCHNCNIATSLDKLIEHLDPALHKSYRLEKFENKQNSNFDVIRNDVIKNVVILKTDLSQYGLIPISELSAEHRALSYLQSRKIPVKFYSELYYVPSMKELERFSPMYEGKLSKEERIAIPYYNKENELIGLSCRAMGNSALRYLTVRKTNDPLVYGIQRVNLQKSIYVIEGPFDSMFIENSIAPGGTDFIKATNMIPKENAILVFDNQPRNAEVIKRMEKMISYGYKMVIWPNAWNFKDINEAIISGLNPKDVEDLLNRNTHKDLSLKLALRNWKKI